jgi:hypothetical protein
VKQEQKETNHWLTVENNPYGCIFMIASAYYVRLVYPESGGNNHIGLDYYQVVIICDKLPARVLNLCYNNTFPNTTLGKIPEDALF